MSSKDIHTGVSTSADGFLGSCTKSDEAELIAKRILEYPGIENFLACKTEYICYTSVCEFWKNAKALEDVVSSTVGNEKVVISQEILRQTFGFKKPTGEVNDFEWKERKFDLWVMMINDLGQHPEIVPSIHISEIHEAFGKFQKVVSQSILGNSGAMDTLSIHKIDIMTAIMFEPNFNFPLYIIRQMQDVVRKERSAKTKMEEDKKEKTGYWYGPKKPFGFLIQRILNDLGIQMVHPTKVSGMKVKDAKDKPFSRPVPQKKRKIETVVQPPKKKVETVSKIVEKESEISDKPETKKRKKIVIKQMPKSKSDEQETETESEELPVKDVIPEEPKKLKISKREAAKRKVVLEESELETDSEDLQPLRATSIVVKEKLKKKVLESIPETAADPQPPLKKAKHGKGKELHKLTQEERKDLFPTTDAVLPGEKEVSVEGEKEKEKKKKKKKVKTPEKKNKTLEKEKVSPGDTTTQTSQENIYGDILTKDIEDISLPETEAAETLTKIAEKDSAKIVVKSTIVVESQVVESVITPTIDEEADPIETAVSIGKEAVESIVSEESAPEVVIAQKSMPEESAGDKVDTQQNVPEESETAEVFTSVEDRISQWIQWKISPIEDQASTLASMIAEEKWALDMMQIGSFADLVNVEAMLKVCMQCVAERSETPAATTCQDPKAKGIIRDDSDKDDNDGKSKDKSDKEARLVMEKQRDELAGRFVGESSHVAEKGKSSTAAAEDTQDADMYVFKAADPVMDDITLAHMQDILTTEPMTNDDTLASPISDVSENDVKAKAVLKHVLEVITQWYKTAEEAKTCVGTQTTQETPAEAQTAEVAAPEVIPPEDPIPPTVSEEVHLNVSSSFSTDSDPKAVAIEEITSGKSGKEMAVTKANIQENTMPSSSADTNLVVSQQTLISLVESVKEIRSSVKKITKKVTNSDSVMSSMEIKMTEFANNQWKFQQNLKDLTKEVRKDAKDFREEFKKLEDGFKVLTEEFRQSKPVDLSIPDLENQKNTIVDALGEFIHATNEFRIDNRNVAAVVHDDVADLRDSLDAFVFDAANKGEILVLDASVAQKLAAQKKLARACDRLKEPEEGRATLTEELKREFDGIWKEGRSFPFLKMDYSIALRKFLEYKVFQERLRDWRIKRNEKMKRDTGKVQIENADKLYQLFMDEYLEGLFRPEKVKIEDAWLYWKIQNHMICFDTVEDKLKIFLAEQVADIADQQAQENIT